jgi:UDP-glucose 4-epimerase
VAEVVVIGGAGFVGGNLVPELIKGGHSVRVLDLVEPDGAVRLAPVMDQIEYRWQSMLDFSLDDLDSPDVVVYLAAQADVPLGISSPTYTFQQNVLSTVRYMHEISVLGNMAPRTIYMSSESVYGVVPKELQPITEEAPLNPTNAYGVSKLCAEAVVRAYAAQYDLPVTVLRSTTLYGPASRTKQVVPIFIRQALAGKPITVEGDGSQSRDFNYVGNLVSAIHSVIAKQVNGVYNIGSGQEVSIKQLAEMVIYATSSYTMLNTNTTMRTSKVTFGPWRPGEKGVQLNVSIDKARRELEYKPVFSLHEGLAKTVYYWAQEPR